MAAKQQTKKGGELPYTPGNNEAIVARIENAKGPVRPGHHNSHRTSNIMDWLKKKESGKTGSKKPSKADAYRQAVAKKAGGK